MEDTEDTEDTVEEEEEEVAVDCVGEGRGGEGGGAAATGGVEGGGGEKRAPHGRGNRRTANAPTCASCLRASWRALAPPKCPWSPRLVGRLLFICAGAAILILLLVFRKWVYGFFGEHGSLPGFVASLPRGVAPLVYVGVSVACVVVLIPVTLFLILSPLLFPNLAIAMLLGITALNLGFLACFLLGRLVFRGWIEEKARTFPHFAALDRAVEQKGLLMVFLLRLSPLVPYNVFNFIVAATAVPLWKHTIASLFGALPYAAVCIYIPWAGTHAIGNIGTSSLAKDLIVYGGGGAAILVFAVVVTWLAQRVLRQSIAAAAAEAEAEAEAKAEEEGDSDTGDAKAQNAEDSQDARVGDDETTPLLA